MTYMIIMIWTIARLANKSLVYQGDSEPERSAESLYLGNKEECGRITSRIEGNVCKWM